MKKILATFLCLCFVVNISFAFDPYEDEEPEKKSKTKLYCGIAMTLIGGFLAYDGFSQEEVDISKPSVDYGGSINAMWLQNEQGSDGFYTLYTGSGTPKNDENHNEQNIIYNTGNVDLTDVKVWIRYRDAGGNVITDNLYCKVVDDPQNPGQKKGEDPVVFNEGYFLASGNLEPSNNSLVINEKREWSDKTFYKTGGTPPYKDEDEIGNVLYNENALNLVNVKVDYRWKPKYKKQNKSDLEGVMGLMVATAGIYFIVDYFIDLHKFNRYMKRNDMKIRLANTPNEYKLVLQKRL